VVVGFPRGYGVGLAAFPQWLQQKAIDAPTVTPMLFPCITAWAFERLVGSSAGPQLIGTRASQFLSLTHIDDSLPVAGDQICCCGKEVVRWSILLEPLPLLPIFWREVQCSWPKKVNGGSSTSPLRP
jgi:hypothetical protein